MTKKKSQRKKRDGRARHPAASHPHGSGTRGPHRWGTTWPWLIGAVLGMAALVAVLLLPQLRTDPLALPDTSAAPEPTEVPRIADLDRLDPRTAEAIRNAVAAVERSPRDGRLWGQLGRTYHAHQFIELAQTCYHQALALDEQNLDWAYLLGLLAAERGRSTEAIDLFERVVAEDPGDVAGSHHLGNALLVEGRLEEASRVFATLERTTPREPWGALGLGWVEMRRERFAHALERLEQAHRLDPDNREVLFALASVYRELGRNDEAAVLLERTENLSPRSPPDPRMATVATARRDLESLIQRANRLLEAQRPEEAEALYRQVLAYDSEHFDAHFDLGVVLGRTGRIHEALEEMKHAARIRPNSAKAERGMGTAYLELGQPELALPHLRRALELDPSDPDLARYLSAVPDLE